MKRRRELKSALWAAILLLSICVPCYATKMMGFNNMDQYISRASNIWIVKCLKCSDQERFRETGTTYEVEVLKKLKGDSKAKLLTVIPISNELVPRRRYLVFSFGQTSGNEVWIDNGAISPVAIPGSLSLNELKGKPVRDQVAIILSARCKELDRLIKRYSEQKSILEEGLEPGKHLDKLEGKGGPHTAQSWGTVGTSGLQIRLVIPGRKHAMTPRITSDRLKARLEVKNTGDRVIRLAEENNTSGRLNIVGEWFVGLYIAVRTPRRGVRRFFRADDQNDYWSRIGGSPSATEIQPGKTASFDIRLHRLVDYEGTNLLSLRGEHELMPVLEILGYNKRDIWSGSATGKWISVKLGS